MPNTKDVLTSPKHPPKTVIKWMLAVTLIGLMLLGYGLNQTSQAQTRQFEAQKLQRETLMQYWQSQGLSEAEINQKLAQQRTQNPSNFKPSLFQTLYRTVRHATGTGPGVRPR